MARITKRAVDALTAREREYMLWDHDIKGFGVRVHPSGRKVYLVKYRHHGRVVKRTIGPHGAIPPAAARRARPRIITAARTGKDLAGRDLRERGAPTMAELAERFVEEYVPVRCKAQLRVQLRDLDSAARAAPTPQPKGRRRHP